MLTPDWTICVTALHIHIPVIGYLEYWMVKKMNEMTCHDPIHNVIIDVSVSQTKLYHVILIRFFK